MPTGLVVHSQLDELRRSPERAERSSVSRKVQCVKARVDGRGPVILVFLEKGVARDGLEAAPPVRPYELDSHRFQIQVIRRPGGGGRRRKRPVDKVLVVPIEQCASEAPLGSKKGGAQLPILCRLAVEGSIAPKEAARLAAADGRVAGHLAARCVRE